MADIVARLKLDNKDYEQKLAKAKKSTKQFSKEGSASMAGLAAAVPQVAIAMVAIDKSMDLAKKGLVVFNNVMKSSQTLGDEYARTMTSAKSAVEQFYYALGSGDWGQFDRGLVDVIRRARGATKALDDLGTNDILKGYLRDVYSAGFRDSLIKAKDERLLAPQRAAAAEAAQAYVDAYAKAIEINGGKALTAIRAVISAEDRRVKPSTVNLESVNRVIENVAVYGREEEYRDAYADIKKLEDLRTQKARNKGSRTLDMATQVALTTQIMELEKKIELNREFYDDAKIAYVLLERWQDEELQNNLKIVQTMAAGTRELAEWRTAMLEINRAMKGFDRSGNLTSLGLPAATTEPLADKINVPGLSPVVVFPEGSYEAYVAAREGAKEAYAAARERAKEYAEALEVLDATAVSASSGLGSIGNAISGMSDLFEDGEGAWLSYAGSIISAVGSALPALEALSAAQAAAAVTKTALNPWTVVSAVTAVGSIVGAMAAIPKFATGGVVPGHDLSGDNVLIRANSGEVVLTKQMAANLGTLLQRGGMGAQTVILKVRGSDLEAVLRNYKSFNAKTYG